MSGKTIYQLHTFSHEKRGKITGMTLRTLARIDECPAGEGEGVSGLGKGI
jgi:hypothetical protein